MPLALQRGIRVEHIDGQAVVLDRLGLVLHHASGDGAIALSLLDRPIDEVDVPAHLVAAMAELIDAGVVTTSDLSRRKLLKVAGASLTGAALITVALASPVAAASGTVGGVPLVKDVNGNTDVPLSTVCLTGGVANSGRGFVTFTRTESPATISVTISLTTGTSAVGRFVYILQSTAGSCVASTTAPVGTWVAVPALGPQTFTAPIVGSATTFVVALRVAGGGSGVNGWSSYPTTLA